MTEQKKNEGTAELAPIQDELDIFKKFDELDDSLVLAEVDKKIAGAWVYHFKQKGKEIWGLAKEGVDQCAILMGKEGRALREGKVTFEMDPTSPEHVIFTAIVSKHFVDKAGQEAAVEQTIGVKRQSLMRKITKQDGYDMVSNEFWAEQGAMKAIRNAKMRLIPEEIKAKVIANAKQLKGKVKTFKGEDQQQKTKPKPADSDLTNPETSPFEKKDEPTPEVKPRPKFPDDEPEPEQVQLREASQSQKNKATAMLQTMVDKYNFAPEDCLAKMDKEAGSHDISTYSDIQVAAVIKYFQYVFDYMDNQ